MIEPRSRSSVAAAAVATRIPCDDCSEEPDNDTHKYQRHGSALASVQQWISRHGKSLVAVVVCLVLSLFLLPSPQWISRQLSATSLRPPASSLRIPPCPTAPWKADEDLRGKCPSRLTPIADAGSVATCAASCCADPACVTWQFRQDTGCLQGGDVRLGQEKDGTSAWCSDHPPQRWRGQFVRPKGVAAAAAPDVRAAACDARTWDPDAEPGQCFGLGDEKRAARGSAAACRAACCADAGCGAWQWNAELGCFYSKSMHGCQGGDDPAKFEPFVGRRKRVASRRYTGKRGQPWQMTLT